MTKASAAKAAEQEPEVDEAVAAGLADGPERVEPEVVRVDTDGDQAEPGDVEAPEGAEIHHLPVRREASSHPDLGTLVPLQEEMRGVAQLAVTLATSKLVPKALQDKPADVLAIILTGRELGVAPMTACRMFHVIGGTVTLAPKVRMAMVRERGLGRIYPHQPPRQVLVDGAERTKLCPCGNPSDEGTEGDPDVQTWHAERNDTPGIVYTSTYSRAMAGAVKFDEWTGSDNNRRKVEKSLLDKDNWKNYPAQMVQWRCLGYLLDQAFSEVGTGLYSPDEIGAVTDDQGEPILDVTSTEVLVPDDTSPAAVARRRTEEQRANRTPDPPAPPDTVTAFKARIDALRRYEGAVQALAQMWSGWRPNGNAADPLPRIDDLLYKQCQLASAVIDGIEKRAAKGEFGDPGDPPADDAPPAGDDPSGGDQAPPDEEPEPGAGASIDPATSTDAGVEELAPEPAAPPGEPLLDVSDLPTGRDPSDDLRWLVKAPDELVAKVIDDVKAVAKDELSTRLRALELPTTGNEDQKRQRLATRIVRMGMERLAGVVPTKE